jgi:hypothetical protein
MLHDFAPREMEARQNIPTGRQNPLPFFLFWYSNPLVHRWGESHLVISSQERWGALSPGEAASRDGQRP